MNYYERETVIGNGEYYWEGIIKKQWSAALRKERMEKNRSTKPLRREEYIVVDANYGLLRSNIMERLSPSCNCISREILSALI